MCAILGVSFAPDSTINRRKLASSLLTFGEVRGKDASGFAFVTPDGDGVFKKDVPGSKLFVGSLPQDSSAMILHTRAATHGSARDNDNNHPVLSPSGDIRLVHNGVIQNHNEIRELLGKVGKSLPDVDSSVIPALIEEFGLDASDQLAGYASAAWFDRETGDAIHLARFKQSTVSFAYLFDGSLAFASTPDILGRALNKAEIPWWGSYPSIFDSMDEGSYFQIMGGEIITESEVEWKARYSYSGPDYSAQTSGGKSQGSSYTVPTKPASTYEGGTVPKPGAGFGVSKGSEDAPSKGLVVINHGTGEVSDADETIEGTIVDDEGKQMNTRDVVAMVFSNSGSEHGVTDEEFENWLRTGDIHDGGDPDMPSFEDYLNDGGADLFYTMSHDGDYVTFTTLNGLVQKLKWEAGVTGGEDHLVGPEEGEVRWVNQIADVGAINVSDGDQYSWVRSDGDFQAVAHLVPSWIGEGLGKLRNLVGA